MISRALRMTTTMAALAMAFTVIVGGPALADRIKNPIAVFSGLDKITGRTISFEVAINETVQFGSLQVTPKVCYTRPPTEPPNTTAFVEVDDIGYDNSHKRIFDGWMFASSPGLHGVQHPVYDVWLTDCKGGKEIIVDPKPADQATAPAQPPGQPLGQPAAPGTQTRTPSATNPAPALRGAGQPAAPQPTARQPVQNPAVQRAPLQRMQVEQAPRNFEDRDVPLTTPRQPPDQRFFPSDNQPDDTLRPPGDIGPLR